MNYLVAVSGGVDSVVLLDMLSRTDHKLAVAHVDHGIRGEESAADARFVRELARRYDLPFVATELKLGSSASEELARKKRYDFLFREAENYKATIVTAHHLDDLVETVALNLTRGTGWRGLGVLARQGISRPLLSMTKGQLYEYALAHHLEWVEDATNASDTYLRNRIRKIINQTVDYETKGKLAELRARQLELRSLIDAEMSHLLPLVTNRYFMTLIDSGSATELLAARIEAEVGARPLRGQTQRALTAIKTARPGTTHQVSGGIELSFTSRHIAIKRV